MKHGHFHENQKASQFCSSFNKQAVRGQAKLHKNLFCSQQNSACSTLDQLDAFQRSLESVTIKNDCSRVSIIQWSLESVCDLKTRPKAFPPQWWMSNNLIWSRIQNQLLEILITDAKLLLVFFLQTDIQSRKTGRHLESTMMQQIVWVFLLSEVISAMSPSACVCVVTDLCTSAVQLHVSFQWNYSKSFYQTNSGEKHGEIQLFRVNEGFLFGSFFWGIFCFFVRQDFQRKRGVSVRREVELSPRLQPEFGQHATSSRQHQQRWVISDTRDKLQNV